MKNEVCVYLFHVFSVCCRLSSVLMLGEAEVTVEEHLSDTNVKRKSHTSAVLLRLPERLVTSIS